MELCRREMPRFCLLAVLRRLWFTVLCAFFAVSAQAQWINYQTPGTPLKNRKAEPDGSDAESHGWKTGPHRRVDA